MGAQETVRANRRWWDAAADDYQSEHGDFLGGRDAARFIWGPEGLDEADAQLLGPTADLAGRRVLEVGCGAAQCSGWLAAQGAVGGRLRSVDASAGARDRSAPASGLFRLTRAQSRSPTPASTSPAAPTARCPSWRARPPCCARCSGCLRPGGRFVFSVTHPIRWAFPDDPGVGGLTVRTSYFDRTPYVEADADGRATYVEHHRTLGDRVRDIVAAGFTSPTSSSRSGRPKTPRCGAAGRRCAVG